MINHSSSTTSTDLINKQNMLCENNKNTSWDYKKNTDDFGKIVNAFLCTKGYPEHTLIKTEHTYQNLIKIGQREGFKVIPTHDFYYVRDSKIRLANGKVLRTTDVKDDFKIKACDRSFNREKFLKNNHVITATKHPSLAGKVGKGLTTIKYHQLTAEGFSKKSRNSPYDKIYPLSESNYFVDIKPSRCAWEGGNVITATNTKGELKVLVGDELLTINHQILRQTKFFDNPNLENNNFSNIQEREGTIYQLKDDLNLKYRNGQISQEVKNLAPNQTDMAMIKTGEEMNAMGLILKFQPKANTRLQAITQEYLGQKRFVKEVLWPMEFEVDPISIETITQAAYHLDVFMKPGPNGSMFLQSYEKDIELLESISKNIKLTERDQKIVNTCLNETRKLIQELKPIYAQVKHQLSNAGFSIIETPGLFHCIDNNKRLDCNFINALSGWSKQTERFYYICLGTKLGDNLGNILMESFRSFMEHHVSPIQVYFIGYNSDNQFNEADFFNNNKAGGVHCMTYELDTESFCKS